MTRRGIDFIFKMMVDGIYQPVCYATDCIINETYEMLEITGPQSKWKDYIPDYAGYTLEVPGMQVYEANANILQIQSLGRAGTKFAWQATAFGNGGVVETGFVRITSISKSSQFRDALRFSMSAIGCGAPQTLFVPISQVVYLSDFSKRILPGCPNAYPVEIFWYDGTMIGIATNADEVIQVFNEYSASHGNYYTLASSVDNGCYFNMNIDYAAPTPYPTTIFAQQGGMFAISTDQALDNVLSPDQDSDNVLTPIG